MKKKVTLLSLFLVGAANLWAGQEHWFTDFEKAKAEAAARNVPILVDFAGSDWCGWCIRLDDEVFEKNTFKAYAEENLILFLADFPSGKPQSAAEKKQNEALSNKYGVSGFPTVVLIDAEGKELGRTGYRKGGPAKYIEHIKDIIK